MVLLIAAVGPGQAIGIGLILTTYVFGLRHGMDWDHIAAITDITSSQDDSRRSMFFSTLYALGHALVVFVLGVAAIEFSSRLPDSVDAVMERFVGVTLILLGVYVSTRSSSMGGTFGCAAGGCCCSPAFTRACAGYGHA